MSDDSLIVRENRAQRFSLDEADDIEYTVIVRDQRFTLHKSQILCDAPNFFTAAFLGEFSEASTRTLRLHRNPELFALIVEHLSGYKILPLSELALPRTMTRDVAIKNLIMDAEYYGLEGLYRLLTEPSIVVSSRVVKEIGYFPIVISLTDVINKTLPSHVEWHWECMLYRESSTGHWQSPLVYGQDLTLLFYFCYPPTPSARREPFKREGGRMRIFVALDKDRMKLPRDFIEGTISLSSNEVVGAPREHTLWFVEPNWTDVDKYTDISVDGVMGSLADISKWWEGKCSGVKDGTKEDGFRPFATAFPGIEATDCSRLKQAYLKPMLFADEVLFTITGSRRDSSLRVCLQQVKARSRRSVLSDISAPSSKWQQDFGSNYGRYRRDRNSTMRSERVDTPDELLGVCADSPSSFSDDDSFSGQSADAESTDFDSEGEDASNERAHRPTKRTRYR